MRLRYTPNQLGAHLLVRGIHDAADEVRCARQRRPHMPEETNYSGGKSEQNQEEILEAHDVRDGIDPGGGPEID